MKTFFYTAVLLVFFASCRHHKSVVSSDANSTTTTQQGDVQIQTDESTTATVVINNSPDTVVTTVVADNSTTTTDTVQVIYRLSISFISKGEGIDGNTQESFLKWVLAQPSHPKYDEYHWGREGEINYCFKLSELSTREQEIFVRDVRTQLTDKELVFVSEYALAKGTKVK